MFVPLMGWYAWHWYYFLGHTNTRMTGIAGKNCHKVATDESEADEGESQMEYGLGEIWLGEGEPN